MSRHIEIALQKRGVIAVARLLDEHAPRTCAAIWDALPRVGDAYHAKYARNEIYALVPAFADPEPGPEHTTITPIPGDVVYFGFEPYQLAAATHGYREQSPETRLVDLAVFYGRNNLLLNPDFGWVPGNVFASIVEGLDELADDAAHPHVLSGDGEQMRFARRDG